MVTAPARAGSRGRPAQRPVAREAERLGLSVFSPERLSVPGATDEVLSWRPDVLVVAAYGGLLPTGLLDRVPLGGINVHASLLPRWRGASPVAAAILAGDAVTGITIMQMAKGLDTGGIIKQEQLPIVPDATTPVLTGQLAILGARALSLVLRQAAPGQILLSTPQDEQQATYAPRLTRVDAQLDWAQASAEEVDRRLRALNPWPGVQAPVAGVPVKLIAGRVDDTYGGVEDGVDPRQPGAVVRVEQEAVLLACATGLFRLERVLPPGRKEMSAAAFLRGVRI